ncbi:UNVERIFIED_CONTAM: hypothetical protein FKN15_041327 [Acipenser sinensis]
MSDCSENGDSSSSKPRRQRASPSPERAAPAAKKAKVDKTESEALLSPPPPQNGDSKKPTRDTAKTQNEEASVELSSFASETDKEKARECDSAPPVGEDADSSPVGDAPPASGGSARLKDTEQQHDSDWAAMVAAEALASLTRGGGGGGGGGGGDTEKEVSRKAKTKRKSVKSSTANTKPEDSPTEGTSSQHTDSDSGEGSPVVRASDTSPDEAGTGSASEAGKPSKTDRVVDSEGAEAIYTSVEDDEAEVETGSSSPAASSSSSSSSAEDAECAIVSVETRVAPETRRSLETLAQIQGELEEIEKRAARLYRRMELKFNQMRRPHVEKRNAVIQGIPGFWVTAVSFYHRDASPTPQRAVKPSPRQGFPTPVQRDPLCLLVFIPTELSIT